MPFGYEQKEMEKRREEDLYMRKVEFNDFIEVKAMMYKNGDIMPVTFKWEDREIRIQKILNVRKGSSLKEKGIPGTRFLCQAMNIRFYLYFTGKQWYMEM